MWLGVAGRALVDKLLALRGGGELVATWAQLGNVTDLISGVSMSGLGVAVTALVAQAHASERAALLRAAVWLSAATSGAFALAAFALWAWSPRAIVPQAHQMLVPWAVLNGVVLVVPALWSAALVGLGRMAQAVALALGGIGCGLAGLWLAPQGQGLLGLSLAQSLFCLCTGAAWLWRLRASVPLSSQRKAQLLRFVPAGLSIGLLSPLSLTVARLAMAEHLSWEAAGQVQALWRTTEWITITVSGMLGYYYLPRLSAAAGAARPALDLELSHALRHAVAPAAVALALAWMALPTLQAWLYTPQLAMPRAQAMPFVLGDAARLLSWVYLYALYAQTRSRAIAVGELLSLPLFAAALVVLGAGLTVSGAGWAWAGTFVAYAAFNWAAARPRSDAGADPARGLLGHHQGR